MDDLFLDVEFAAITPEMAREWVGFNTHNRSLRARSVTAYAADMKNGDWHANGESIKFAADGTLLDGQHRLHAVIESDVTVKMLVVRGLPNQAQDTLDNGLKRTFADVLRLRGEAATVTLASVARRVAMWEDGDRTFKSAGAPTVAQLSAVIGTYPSLRETARLADHVSRSCGLPPSIVGFCAWLFGQVPDAGDDVDFFFARLADFQGLSKGDAIYVLRKTIESSRSAHGQRSAKYLVAITIKAWNAFRAGETISILRFTTGGAHPEKFPEPI